MLQLPRWDGEGFVQYQKRSASVARDMLRKCNIEPVAVRALKAKRGWAGHLARAPPSSPLGRLLRFRSPTWWKDAQDSLPKLDRHNYLKWRHSRTGRFLRWENALYRYDEHWLVLASDRETWKKSSTFTVQCELQYLNGRNLVDKDTADELGDSGACYSRFSHPPS